jgi:hypothetical protein
VQHLKFTATFVATPGVDGLRSFRALLKVALRRFGLRAIDVRELHDEPTRETTDDHPQRTQAT